MFQLSYSDGFSGINLLPQKRYPLELSPGNVLATQCPPVSPFNDAGMPDPGIDRQPKNKLVGLRPVERTIPLAESDHACSCVTTTSINMSRFLGPSTVLSKKSGPTTPWQDMSPHTGTPV
ncbi:hypothetical protein TNIN_3061 [Trichonephila inaurata madagascariensis]|uniref:Uncharacterized protein n=1 Tax=Trichonephila inaurata madagascariensis TaxID=2747483 RepID=A0A8X6J8W6_9ARAC|nr:hypothetical protein TNIN_3061 [Trichonephila inaurata madagascariensis]